MSLHRASYKVLISLCVSTCLLAAAVLAGQSPRQSPQATGGALGRIDFPTSGSPSAQEHFLRGVAALHSFWYEEALEAFQAATKVEPGFALGYWGEALAHNHPLWNEQDAEAARRTLAKIPADAKLTARESAYLNAVKALYGEGDKHARDLAYAAAMEKVYKDYPADLEAASFYALSLLGAVRPTDKGYRLQAQAGAIALDVYAKNPNHPGAAHYIIHAFDDPEHAILALPAARRYAEIAPDAHHARHMPSHIFTRLGLWQEAIRSNLGAKAAAEAHAVRNRLPGAWDEQFHAMDYLAYAYLQGAQDKQAGGLLDELNKIRRVDPPNFKVAYAFTAIPARYALERRQWNEAAKLPLHPGTMETFPWERFRWAEAQVRFARAIGLARTGDAAAARREVEELAAIRQALVEVKGDYDWGKQVEIKRQVASGWLAHAEGKQEESLRLMRAAAELDDATEKHPVTPGTLLPAREQLGELLLELRQPAAALQEFETALRSAPNRFNGLYGAARAAKLAADRKRAKTYYGQLLALCRRADSPRAEIEEAKVFLNGVNVPDSVSTR